MRAPLALNPSSRSHGRGWASSLAGGTLLRRFTILSLLATLGIGSIFGWAGSRLAEDYALRSQAQAVAVQVSAFMAPRLVPGDFAGRTGARRVQFEFATRDLLGKAGIVHVRVWNAKGDLLYSRGASPSGTRMPPPEVERALIGEISSRFVGGRERGEPRRLEVSVPIRLSKTGALVGAYQVVADITDLSEAIRRLKLTVWESIILGILVLYLVLFTLVRRASEDLVRQQEQLRQGFIGTIESLARAVDARDGATADHSSRVARYAEAIAQELHLKEDAVQQVTAAAFLHDVGKIGIRDDILATESALTDAQWELVRRHPVTGYEILQPVPIPEAIRLAVLHSHEAWDGSGYPNGLIGEAIPLAARIIAVADAYEVLTTGRPYKAARSHADALREIARRSRTQFDPGVVDALTRALHGTAPVRDAAAPVRPRPSPDPGA
jgi:HD-GYP domain-containing protein (c-di-GMP phosphodiesterase class II)